VEYSSAPHKPIAYNGNLFSRDPAAIVCLQERIGAGKKAWKLNIWIDADGKPVTPFGFDDLTGLVAAIDAAKVPQFSDLIDAAAKVILATSQDEIEAITF